MSDRAAYARGHSFHLFKRSASHGSSPGLEVAKKDGPAGRPTVVPDCPERLEAVSATFGTRLRVSIAATQRLGHNSNHPG